MTVVVGGWDDVGLTVCVVIPHGVAAFVSSAGAVQACPVMVDKPRRHTGVNIVNNVGEISTAQGIGSGVHVARFSGGITRPATVVVDKELDTRVADIGFGFVVQHANPIRVRSECFGHVSPYRSEGRA